MSCFPGRMNEYRFISIDRFDGDNLLSRIYFLSHCHEDHMIGLDSPRLISHLAANNYRVYVQEITYHLLLHESRYRHLKDFLQPLCVNEPHMLLVPKEKAGDGKEHDTITVTFLPAGHCPGSVMFLFEGAEGTVLYTGDIRLSWQNILDIQALRNGTDAISIRSVYFDSTFCTAETAKIVDRQDSLKAVLELTKEHFDSHPSNKVLLYCAQKYGHEFLMRHLNKELGMKVHVSGSRYELYKKIDEIGPHLTPDGASTRLHACAFYTIEDEELSVKASQKRKESGPRYRQHCSAYSMPSCPDCRSWDPRVMVIKPSMLWFMKSKSITDVVHHDKRVGVYRVQYSCHSSLTEIRQLLAYLRPQFAYPNVVPFRSKDYTPVYDLLGDLVTKIGRITRKTPHHLSSRGTSTTMTFPAENLRISSEVTVISNFSNRKRYIESVKAQKKKQKVREDRVGMVTTTGWEACLQLSDSDLQSSDEESERVDSVDSNGNDTTKSGSMGIVDESDIEEVSVNVKIEKYRPEDVTSESQPVSSASNGNTAATGDIRDYPEQKSNFMERQDEAADTKSGENDTTDIQDQPKPQSDSIEICRYDSDMDLFDSIDNQPIDDDTGTVTISTGSSSESIQFIGTFNKSDNAPLIVLSPDDDVKFATVSSPPSTKPITNQKSAGMKTQRPAKVKKSNSAPSTCTAAMIDDDDEEWLREAWRSMTSASGKPEQYSQRSGSTTSHDGKSTLTRAGTKRYVSNCLV